MILNISAGHNPDGKIACGAVGIIKESTEARKVKDEVCKILKSQGHIVYDCTVDNGENQSDVLSKIVKKCNATNAELNVSIHFNSGANDNCGNGKTTGTEVLVYSKESRAFSYADRVCKSIASLGFKNRGVKVNTSLYVLRKSSAPCILIECCFVDDKDDVALYDYKKMAKAIVEGILNKVIETKEEKTSNKTIYRVQVGAYSKKENAIAMQKKLKDAGFDAFITK